MNDKPENPPAFPQNDEILANPDIPGSFEGVIKLKENFRGLSMRDFFAAAALQGWTSSLNGEALDDLSNGTRGGKFIAQASYALADAMLKARQS